MAASRWHSFIHAFSHLLSFNQQMSALLETLRMGWQRLSHRGAYHINWIADDKQVTKKTQP